MNITKNKLIEALEYLGEFPKTSHKKEELMHQLNEMYDKKIDQLVVVINIKIYNLLKKLVQAKGDFIEIEDEYEPEVDFLESILLIEKPIINNEKIFIKLYEEMREKITKFINKTNEENVKKNQTIVDLIINMTDVYGIMADYEMLEIFNKMLNIKMNIELLYAFIHNQIDLRSEITIVESDNEIYFMNCLVQYPEDIIEERKKRNLYYKEYTMQELEQYNLENLINCKEAKELIKFIENKKIEFSEELVFSIILYIMNIPQINVEDFLELIKVDFKDIDEANEYLQLVMQLHNNIPHYALYGYTPMDLVKMQIEERTKAEKNKKKKVGRNEFCPCGSGKKYKNCCMNKIIKVDFRNEKYADCVDEEESKMFFALKNLLFYYTNQKYNINNELKDFEDICDAEPEEVKKIREKIWNDPNIIKEYIEENPNEISDELIDVLKKWSKKKVNKEFILYKYEYEYTVFMDDDNIYYVKGLKEQIRNMVSESQLPTIVKTVLLPLKNHIIYDSYLEHFNVAFGPGMRKTWEQNYKEMLKQNKIKHQL